MGLGRVKTHCGECGGKTDKADDRYSGRVSVTKFASVIPSFKSFTPVWCSSIGGAGETSSPSFVRWRATIVALGLLRALDL